MLLMALLEDLSVASQSFYEAVTLLLRFSHNHKGRPVSLKIRLFSKYWLEVSYLNLFLELASKALQRNVVSFFQVDAVPDEHDVFNVQFDLLSGAKIIDELD